MCYTMGYETPWNTSKSGKTKNACHRLAKIRQDLPMGSSQIGRFSKLGSTLGSSLSQKRQRSIASQADSGASALAVRETKKETGEHSPSRTSTSRLQNRALDVKACGRGDRGEFWHSLLNGKPLEADAQLGVELPEAREASTRTGREGDRALETLSVAPYKKKPKDLGHIWPSSMKVVFFWFPMSSARGLREVRPRSCVSLEAIVERSLLSLRSVFPPGGEVSPCMPGSVAKRTSGLLRWQSFSVICSSTYADRLSSCGTPVVLTKGPRSRSFSSTIPGFTPTSFLATLLNSTRPNSFGTTSNMLRQTASRKICVISNNFCIHPFKGFYSLKIFFGHASMHRICHGKVCIHYLVKHQ